MSRSHYAYITGKIRALETGLPDEVDLERMLDAPDVKAAFEVLNDTDYAHNLLDVTPENFNFALHDNWRDLRKMLEDGVPDRVLLDILYLREDFNNLKLVLKTYFQELVLADVKVTDAGSVSKEAWLSHFNPDVRSDLSSFWQEVVGSILDELGTPEHGQLVDRVADKKYLEVYAELTRQFKNPFVKKLVSIEIDVANSKAALRARKLSRDEVWLTPQLVAGGTIPVGEFAQWLEVDDVELVRMLHNRLPYTIAVEMEQGYAGSGPEALEHALYTWRRRYLRRAIYTAYGPEHVMRYYYAKVRSLVNVRVVMMGKLNGLPREDIKKRIRL